MTLREPRTGRRLVAASSLLTLLSVSLAAFAQSGPTRESSTAAEAVAPASAAQNTASNPVGNTGESTPRNTVENAAENTFEEVLVTGEQPGPGLWKVSRGEHTLWILGTYTPLPKKFKWRSKGVEALIAESQELLTSGSVDADANIGFFKALTLLPAALAVRKNPDGKTLQEVLPSEVYAKWLEVNKKYIGNDRGIEKFRPLFAALELTREA
ncbi:MAG TPA: TraB/GumN family protein, partial [Povalibacter sp.]